MDVYIIMYKFFYLIFYLNEKKIKIIITEKRRPIVGT